MLHSEFLSCPIMSDHDASYINLPKDKYEVRHKFITTLTTVTLKFYHLQPYTLLTILIKI